MGRKTSLAKLGGSIGMASCFVNLGAFLMILASFDAAFMLVPLGIILGAIGFIIAIVGGVTQKYAGPDETQPLAAFFVSFMGLVGGSFLWMLHSAPVTSSLK
jgi:hypothetical protein